MPSQRSRDLVGYEVAEDLQVVAAFRGDATSDAGALLLGGTDRPIGLVAQRVLGIALVSLSSGGVCPTRGRI